MELAFFKKTHDFVGSMKYLVLLSIKIMTYWSGTQEKGRINPKIVNKLFTWVTITLYTNWLFS